jgi:hypothetical protein
MVNLFAYTCIYSTLNHSNAEKGISSAFIILDDSFDVVSLAAIGLGKQVRARV